MDKISANEVSYPCLPAQIKIKQVLLGTDSQGHMGGEHIGAASSWNAPKLICLAQWLHRSAYCYGGNGNPDSSQTRANLIFGTYEANTEMVR
jgi:hypothetical protein